MNGENDSTSVVGFPRELLKNKSDLTERIICGVCNLILRDVVQHECGHRFCSSCANTLLSEPQPQFCPRCPAESQEAAVRNIYPDYAGRKEIRLLKVKCLNSTCPYEGTLDDYAKNHQGSCPHEKVPCPHCRKQMKRVELQNHCSRDCTERTITCRWCNTEMVHKNMKQHNTVCPKLEILCEICKKSKLPREQIKSHQDPEKGDCPRRKRCCKFRMVGCEFTAPQEQMPGHLKNNLAEHLNLLMGDYITVKEELELAQMKLKKSESFDTADGMKSISLDSYTMDEVVERVIQKLKVQNRGIEKPDIEADSLQAFNSDIDEAKAGARRKLMNADHQTNIPKEGVVKGEGGSSDLALKVKLNTQRINSLQKRQDVLQKKNDVFHDVVGVLNTELESNGRKIMKVFQIVEECKTSVEETEKHLKAVSQEVTVKSVAINEQFLQIQSLENIAYSGILVWKITNFSQKRRDAINGKQTSLYSPYFFTSRYGYRVCCRIYLNGDGMGKGTHISIFFVIMKGKYDALQVWPFRQKVNFILLDQNNLEHVVDGFRPDDKSSSFRRPTSDMNIASGCPLFISMSELEASPNAYIKDDTMFIKVIVDMSNINSSNSGI